MSACRNSLIRTFLPLLVAAGMSACAAEADTDDIASTSEEVSFPSSVTQPTDTKTGSSMETAVNIGELSDNSDWKATLVTTGGDGVSWLTFHGNDSGAIGPVCNPSASLYAPDSDQVCVFVDCDKGLRKLKCPKNTYGEAAGAAMGCCTDGTIDPELVLGPTKFDCVSYDDSAQVYVQVIAQPYTTYELEYRY